MKIAVTVSILTLWKRKLRSVKTLTKDERACVWLSQVCLLLCLQISGAAAARFSEPMRTCISSSLLLHVPQKNLEGGIGKRLVFRYHGMKVWGIQKVTSKKQIGKDSNSIQQKSAGSWEQQVEENSGLGAQELTLSLVEKKSM